MSRFNTHAWPACVFGLHVAKFELMGVIRWPMSFCC